MNPPPFALAGLALALSSSLSLASVAGQAPPACSVEFLGVASSISALSENGTVVGQRAVGNATRAWVSVGGQPLALLPLLPGDQSSWGLDVNEQGVIVGALSTSTSPEFGGRAAEWLPDGAGGYSVHALGQLPGHSGSVATAVNNLGDIVGYSVSGMFRYPVLFSAPGGVLDLNPLGVFDPQAVNDQRQMLDKQSKRLDLDTFVVETFPLPSGPPSYSATTGYAMNSFGQIAGTAVLATSTSCVYQAARRTNSGGWQMLTSCSPLAAAFDINDRGDVLYQAISLTKIVHLEGVGEFVAQQFVAPDAGPWSVVSTFSLNINDARQLAAIATNTETGVTGAVLLTPQGQCQTDLGFGGPGPARLSVCGGDLSTGTTATVSVWGAPESGLVYVVAGFVAAPTPFFSGTLVPLPFLLAVPLGMGPAGSREFSLGGGAGLGTVYAQCVTLDASLPGGFGLSNAVQLDFLP